MITKLAIPNSSAYRCVSLRDEYRRLGIHLVAGRGTGKSRFLGRLLGFQDVFRGVPTIIIDPVGATINNLIDKIGRLHPDDQRRIWPRVRYVDMNGRGDYVFPFPLYYRLGTEHQYTMARRFVDAIGRADPNLEIAPVQGMNAIRHIGTYVGIALSSLGLQISEAESLLTDPEPYIRRLQSLKQTYSIRQTIRFFQQGHYQAQASMFRSKIADIVLDPINRTIFAASTQDIVWSDLLDKHLCVLIDISQETDTYMKAFKMLWVYRTFITFILSQRLQRTTPISLIIDEFASMYNLKNDAVNRDMEELINVISRNHNIWLTLAHQEMYQFEEKTQESLMTLGTQIVGATTDPDAAFLFTKHFDRIDPMRIKRTKNVWANTGSTHLSEFLSYNALEIIDHTYDSFTVPEQLITESYKYLDQLSFHFWVKLAMRSSLTQMSIENLDRGIYPDMDVVERDKNILMKLHGVPIEDEQGSTRLMTARSQSTPNAIIEYEAPYDIPAGDDNDEDPLFKTPRS